MQYVRAKIYAEWHNSPLCCTKIYSICVFPVRSPSVQNVCSVGWFVLYGFYGSYGIFVHQHPCFSVWSVQFSPFICIRVFPCVPCSLFYSNTESHGFSRSLIHLHPSNPCDPWADLFCTDLTDTTDIFARTRIFTECHGISVHLHPCFSVWSVQFSPFICIRVIRVIRTDFFGVFVGD